MPWNAEPVFQRLKVILRKHAGQCTVAEDSVGRFCLEAPIGPATLKVWKGKAKKRVMPVAWVQIGKAFVSYHLMGVYVNPNLTKGMSAALRGRMQGKACFNFKSVDEGLYAELERLTTESINGMRTSGFILDGTD